jgi:hypothetical protein
MSGADDRVCEEACRILARLYPGASWRRLPGVGVRSEAAAPAGYVERLVAVEDDPDSVANISVSGAARGGADEHGGDARGEEAA